MHPKNKVNLQHIFIDSKEKLSDFYQQNKNAPWLAFDTEFIGENKFKTQLCLIQIVTEHGIFLIDTLKLINIELFLQLIQDPNILKITHAGDNDYRLLYQNFNITPKNVFDTQVAAGFINMGFPISFNKLVVRLIHQSVSKSYSVTNWAERPLSDLQIKYAINDVTFLKKMYDELHRELIKQDKLTWCELEFKNWENKELYTFDPISQFFSSLRIDSFSLIEKVFLLRLLKWRMTKAKESNINLEMVLPKKSIFQLIKTYKEGINGIKQNRLISNRFLDKYYDQIAIFKTDEITDVEKEFVQTFKNPTILDPLVELNESMTLLMAKRHCLKNGIAPKIVLQKKYLVNLRKKMKSNGDWRTVFLGETIISWLIHSKNISIEYPDEHSIILRNN